MIKQGPIPPLVHGALDYVLGALLIAAPFIFGFTASAATAVAIVAGVLLIMLTASTAWTAGLISSVPVRVHAALDYLLGVVLIAAPFVFGFSGDDGSATAFFIAFGVVELLFAIATRYHGAEPRGRRPVRSAPRSP